MTQIDYEALRREYGEMYRLSKHMTDAEKLELAAFLAHYPATVLSGFGGAEAAHQRSIIIKRLGGPPFSHLDDEDMVTYLVGGDIELFLLGEIAMRDRAHEVFKQPSGALL